MKRVISILIMMILLLSCVCNAVAQDFTLRNGIKFLDSRETVIEKQQSLELDDLSNKFDDGTLLYKGKIIDYKAACWYYFDDNKALKGMKYDFRNIFKDNAAVELYELICEKYGNPRTIELDNAHAVKGSAYRSYSSDASLMPIIAIPNCIAYAEWLVDLEGAVVKIELMYYTYIEDEKLYLSYDYFTDEEFARLQEEAKENTLQEQRLQQEEHNQQLNEI